jgi:hypothetical protein
VPSARGRVRLGLDPPAVAATFLLPYSKENPIDSNGCIIVSKQ